MVTGCSFLQHCRKKAYNYSATVYSKQFYTFICVQTVHLLLLVKSLNYVHFIFVIGIFYSVVYYFLSIYSDALELPQWGDHGRRLHLLLPVLQPCIIMTFYSSTFFSFKYYIILSYFIENHPPTLSIFLKHISLLFCTYLGFEMFLVVKVYIWITLHDTLHKCGCYHS